MKTFGTPAVTLCAALGLAVGAYFIVPAKVEASQNCQYGGQSYSQGACLGSQRCSQRLNGDAYWSDDSSCPQVSSGPVGRPQV